MCVYATATATMCHFSANHVQIVPAVGFQLARKTCNKNSKLSITIEGSIRTQALFVGRTVDRELSGEIFLSFVHGNSK